MHTTLRTLFSEKPDLRRALEQVEVVGVQSPEMFEQNKPNTEHLREWIKRVGSANCFRWFLPKEFDGFGWRENELLAAYLALSQSGLTSTFVLTQWHAAVKRILSSSNDDLRQRYADKLASGEIFATVGISHLSTSRQHFKQPVLIARPVRGGFQLTGSSPWVTAAIAADVIVLGATLDDGTQILAAVETDVEGLSRSPGMDLVALSGSCTDRIELDNVFVPESAIIAGPVAGVMQASSGSGGGTGGLQTSTLAIGLAVRAIEYLCQESRRRQTLQAVADKFFFDAQRLLAELFGQLDSTASSGLAELRQSANSLVLRSTQAALQAAKGAGFVSGHPAGQWATEALFFLVWSCPQEVVDANLCELAGLE
jgi:alkylation response protein AidB-like acyl-CoA dehydrogenase